MARSASKRSGLSSSDRARIAAVRDEVVEHSSRKSPSLVRGWPVARRLAVTKALNNNSGGEIIDLPPLPLRRRA